MEKNFKMMNRYYAILLFLLPLFNAFGQNFADSSAVGAGQPEPLNMGWMLFKTMGMLILIIALIFVTVFVLKKYVYGNSFQSAGSEWIRVLGQIQIQPKKYLALVQALNKVVLISITDVGVETLAEFESLDQIQPMLDEMQEKTGNNVDQKFLGLFRKKLES